MDLTISTNVITWKSEDESRGTYMIHIMANSTSTPIKQINTTETHVQYNLEEFNRSDDCRSLSIIVSVCAIYSWSSEVSCKGEESEAKQIEFPFLPEECTYTAGRPIKLFS